MNRTLAAHTPPGASPPFINASEQPDGTVRVIVRSPVEGFAVQAYIDMTRVEFAIWCESAIAELFK